MSELPTINPLIVTAKEIPAVLKIATKTWRERVARGETPAALRLCGKKQGWYVRDLERWLEWGMPSRAEFERMKAEK